MHFFCALLLALEDPAPPPLDPPTEVAAPEDTQPEPTPSSTATPEPFAPPPRIPGVPEGVDLYDESTWSQLSVEDKDRMRAIRAELEYQRTGGVAPVSRATSTVDDYDRPPPRESSSRERSRTTAWQERDRKLATATAVTGVVWGAAVITALVLQFAVIKAVDDCSETVTNDPFGASNDCSDELRRVRRAGAGLIVTSVIAGGAGVGVLVSGITLGVHRNSRPVELSVLPLRLRF